VDECSRCGAELPETARFCPGCGRGLSTDDERSIVFRRVPPKLFGVVPAGATGAVGLVALGLAGVAFALGVWILGLILTLIGVTAFALFAETVRRLRPEDALSRSTLTAARALRVRAGFARTAAEAWGRAGREAFSVRRELVQLKRQFGRLQHALGGAAYSRDSAEADRLRTQMHELDERMAECERRLERAVAEARRRLASERSTLVLPGGRG
jgi:hypothetical protein